MPISDARFQVGFCQQILQIAKNPNLSDRESQTIQNIFKLMKKNRVVSQFGPSKAAKITWPPVILESGKPNGKTTTGTQTPY
jgi:hypothetical protein